MTEAAVPWRSTRRFATVFGAALVAGQLGQLAWLSIGSRTMSGAAFGTVLAAQALYAVLQLVVEAAATFHGARLAAAETLDERARGEVIGLRLRLALGGVAVMAVVAAIGGEDTALALAPYSLALVLFGLFTHWESFGRGSSGPWSTYLVFRGVGLAAISSAFLVAGTAFPLAGAGLVECAAIVSASAAFGFRPLRDLRSGLQARRPPWRSALSIGLPNVVWQLGLASGTVLLGLAGAPAQGARLGVSIRLLTGVDQLGGVLAAALFPRLASSRPGSTAADDVAIGAVVRVACALGLAASALMLLFADVFVRLFLDHADPGSETTAALVLAAAPATTLLVVLSMTLTARRLEAAFFAPFLIGTGVVLATSTAVVLVSPHASAEWLAAAFAGGQLLTLVLLLPRAAAAMPLVRPLRPVGLVTVPAALLAASAALAPELRLEAAIAELGLAAVLAVASLSDVRARARHAV